MERYYDAFLDGILTGADLYGTIIGHVTQNRRWLGYRADIYSLNTPSLDGKPKQRNVSEQVLKGLGDVVGLLALVGLLGVPHIAARVMDSPEDKKLKELLRDAEHMVNRD